MNGAKEIMAQYLEIFGDLPPRDIMISYDSDFYLDLIKKAIKTRKKITKEVFEKAIEGMPYDVVEEKPKRKFNKFKGKK